MFRISARLAVVCGVALGAAVLTVRPTVAQAPAAGGVTAFVNARVIDGTGRPAMERATIVFRNGRIDAVGPNVAVPAGATRVDLAGKTVMPGMVEAHGHVQKGLDASVPVREDLLNQLRMYASYGVTTVMSLGATPDDEREQLRLRDEQDGITLDRARLYTSGGSVRRWKTPEESRKDTNRVADLKVDIIKFHFDDPPNVIMDAPTWGAVVEEAQKRGLRTAPHIFYLKDAKASVEKGVNALAHSVRDLDMDAALLAEMKKRDVGLIPTLTREVTVFAYEETPAWFKDPFFLKGMSLYKQHVALVTDPAYQLKTKNDPLAQSIKKALVQAQKNLKLASDAGITIGFGTDSGVPNPTTFGRFQGYLEHMELELMVASGLTPMQTLVAATSGSAKIIQREQVGTIAQGKNADFLVLDANPLDNIRNTRQINSIWIAGRRLAANGTN